MSDPRPTPDELQHLLVTLLAGATGQGEARWSKVIRRVQPRSMALHPTCNWTVDAKPNRTNREALDKAIAIVREHHPYVRP